MKRTLYLLVAGALALGAGQPTNTIVGTMHDLSPTGYTKATVLGTGSGGVQDASGNYTQVTGTVNEVCIFCHTPHQKQVNGAFDKTVPLWNHTTTSATFTPFTSANLVATAGVPTGMSLACMSCHDGTVGVASVVSLPYGAKVAYNTSTNDHFLNTDDSGRMNPTGGYTLGTDLSGDHPINIIYDNTQAAAALNDTAKLAANGVWLYATTGKRTTNNGDKVQCGSCHDVHRWQGQSGTADGWFLRTSNVQSALCLTCHNK